MGCFTGEIYTLTRVRRRYFVNLSRPGGKGSFPDKRKDGGPAYLKISWQKPSRKSDQLYHSCPPGFTTNLWA